MTRHEMTTNSIKLIKHEALKGEIYNCNYV